MQNDSLFVIDKHGNSDLQPQLREMYLYGKSRLPFPFETSMPAEFIHIPPIQMIRNRVVGFGKTAGMEAVTARGTESVHIRQEIDRIGIALRAKQSEFVCVPSSPMTPDLLDRIWAIVQAARTQQD